MLLILLLLRFEFLKGCKLILVLDLINSLMRQKWLDDSLRTTLCMIARR